MTLLCFDSHPATLHTNLFRLGLFCIETGRTLRASLTVALTCNVTLLSAVTAASIHLKCFTGIAAYAVLLIWQSFRPQSKPQVDQHSCCYPRLMAKLAALLSLHFGI